MRPANLASSLERIPTGRRRECQRAADKRRSEGDRHQHGVESASEQPTSGAPKETAISTASRAPASSRQAALRRRPPSSRRRERQRAADKRRSEGDRHHHGVESASEQPTSGAPKETAIITASRAPASS